MLDATAKARIARMASLAGRRGRRCRIAVAEDDPDMRALVADALRTDGHEVVELADGGELLVQIARRYRQNEHAEPLDLIVSDVRMPVVTGLAILRGLRAAHCSSPVVLMTAFGDRAIRTEAEALDAVVLDKPLRLLVLRDEVRRLLAEHDLA